MVLWFAEIKITASYKCTNENRIKKCTIIISLNLTLWFCIALASNKKLKAQNTSLKQKIYIYIHFVTFFNFSFWWSTVQCLAKAYTRIQLARCRRCWPLWNMHILLTCRNEIRILINEIWRVQILHIEQQGRNCSTEAKWCSVRSRVTNELFIARPADDTMIPTVRNTAKDLHCNLVTRTARCALVKGLNILAEMACDTYNAYLIRYRAHYCMPRTLRIR